MKYRCGSSIQKPALEGLFLRSLNVMYHIATLFFHPANIFSILLTNANRPLHVEMDKAPNSPAEILDITLARVDACASALQCIVDENLSPSSSPRSARANKVLLEVERICSDLRQLTLEVEDALRTSDDAEVNEEGNVSPNDLVPCDYDSEAERPPYITVREHYEQEGIEYDSDDSRKNW